MTPRFFDLSSGEAGAILQKLRTYGVRVALISPKETVRFGGRLPELMAEEIGCLISVSSNPSNQRESG